MIKKSVLIERLDELDIIISKKMKSLDKAPPGSIHINRKGNKIYYDYIYNGRRHLKSNDKADQTLARMLAQKAYDETVLKQAQKERSALMRLLNVYENGCAEDCYASLNAARRQIVVPIRLTDEQYAAEWQAQRFQTNTLPPDIASFITDRGERVRSKSEMLIANKLYARGLCYFYEPKIMLTDHQTGMRYAAHPDFAVLIPHTRKEVLWEHLGMMDNADYVNQNLHRLRDYENCGFRHGDNLIVTYETLKAPLDSRYIDSVIKQCLLQ